MPGCAPVDGNIRLPVTIKVTRRRQIAAFSNAPRSHAGLLAAAQENKPLRCRRPEHSPVCLAIAVIIQRHWDLFTTRHAPYIYLAQAGRRPSHHPLTADRPIYSAVGNTVAIEVRRRRVDSIIVQHIQTDIIHARAVEDRIRALHPVRYHSRML